MDTCYQCGRRLTADEIGAHKKLVNRGAETFLCKTCLATKFRVSEALIDEKIRQFKAMAAPCSPHKRGMMKWRTPALIILDSTTKWQDRERTNPFPVLLIGWFRCRCLARRRRWRPGGSG